MIDQEALRARYNPEGSELRNLQHKLMEVMMILDKICIENNIQYMLTGGNVLGAIRHGGFIPWDDDIDIALLETDYKRLIKILRNYKSDKYILQEHRSDPDYIQPFPKFREKEGVLFGSNPQRGCLYRYKGVAIDIFCISHISYLNARVCAGIHSRLLPWTYKIKKSLIRHLVTSILLGIEKTLFFLCNILNVFRKQNELHHAQGQAASCVMMDSRHLLPFTRKLFEGEMLPLPCDTDGFLTLFYGPDFMELPQKIRIHNKVLLIKPNN